MSVDYIAKRAGVTRSHVHMAISEARRRGLK